MSSVRTIKSGDIHSDFDHILKGTRLLAGRSDGTYYSGIGHIYIFVSFLLHITKSIIFYRKQCKSLFSVSQENTYQSDAYKSWLQILTKCRQKADVLFPISNYRKFKRPIRNTYASLLVSIYLSISYKNLGLFPPFQLSFLVSHCIIMSYKDF